MRAYHQRLEAHERRHRVEAEIDALARFYGLDRAEVRAELAVYLALPSMPREERIRLVAAEYDMDPAALAQIVDGNVAAYTAWRAEGAGCAAGTPR